MYLSPNTSGLRNITLNTSHTSNFIAVPSSGQHTGTHGLLQYKTRSMHNRSASATDTSHCNNVSIHKYIDAHNKPEYNNNSMHSRSVSATDTFPNIDIMHEYIATSNRPHYNNNSIHNRSVSAIDTPYYSTTSSKHKIHSAAPLTNGSTPNDIFNKPMPNSLSSRPAHIKHLSSDILIHKNHPLLNDSLPDKNICLDNISRTKNIPSLKIDYVQEINNNRSILDRSIPMNIDPESDITLTDNALFCLKILISPLSLFFHIGRFAFTSISTTFSFTVAFAISDLIFFSFLDKFDLSYLRYILLGVTGIVAAFSIKGIISSSINLILSVAKGTYSWYFSLINPECHFVDFLFGINEVTIDKS